MLPKQYRLKNRSAFKATYRVKNSFHKGGITLYVALKADLFFNLYCLGNIKKQIRF